MSDLKDKIENNVTIWLLGMVLAGFMAGIGTYEGALKIMQLETVSSDHLNALENQSSGAAIGTSDMYSVPLPNYLGKAEIELLFTKVKEMYNSNANEELFDMLGPIGKAQVSKESAEKQLAYLYESLGKIRKGFFVQHQFVGKLGMYRHFALNFSVEYEKAEKGIATITVIDDGKEYQLYGLTFNRL